MTDRHLSDEEMILLGDNALSEEQKKEALRHIDSCETCRKDLAFISYSFDSFAGLKPDLPPGDSILSDEFEAAEKAFTDASGIETMPSVLKERIKRVVPEKKRIWASFFEFLYSKPTFAFAGAVLMLIFGLGVIFNLFTYKISSDFSSSRTPQADSVFKKEVGKSDISKSHSSTTNEAASQSEGSAPVFRSPGKASDSADALFKSKGESNKLTPPGSSSITRKPFSSSQVSSSVTKMQKRSEAEPPAKPIVTPKIPKDSQKETTILSKTKPTEAVPADTSALTPYKTQSEVRAKEKLSETPKKRITMDREMYGATTESTKAGFPKESKEIEEIKEDTGLSSHYAPPAAVLKSSVNEKKESRNNSGSADSQTRTLNGSVLQKFADEKYGNGVVIVRETGKNAYVLSIPSDYDRTVIIKTFSDYFGISTEKLIVERRK